MLHRAGTPSYGLIITLFYGLVSKKGSCPMSFFFLSPPMIVFPLCISFHIPVLPTFPFLVLPKCFVPHFPSQNPFELTRTLYSRVELIPSLPLYPSPFVLTFSPVHHSPMLPFPPVLSVIFVSHFSQNPLKLARGPSLFPYS